MKTLKIALSFATLAILTLSCNEQDPNNPNRARQQPIDSTNINGTAPVKYSGANPAEDADPNKNMNYHDTGSKANNLHNTGYDSGSTRP